jgi:hypothetical protein
MAQPDGRVDVDGATWRRLNVPGRPGPARPALREDWSGDSARWTQEKKLRSLDPQLRPKVQTVLAKLTARGFRPKIFFGWRSVAVQQELVRLGRSTVRFSFHNAQLPDGTLNAYAAEIVDERWGWESAAENNGF